jgi:hypothetical protein
MQVSFNVGLQRDFNMVIRIMSLLEKLRLAKLIGHKYSFEFHLFWTTDLKKVFWKMLLWRD